MSTLSTFQESSKAAALAVVAKSPETAKALVTSFEQHFSATSLSTVRTLYAAVDLAVANAKLDVALTTTQDAVDAVLNDMTKLEQYVTLTIPKMEDGNNFGVTVQLAAIKAMNETKEKLEKGMEELSKYASSRADALEKCKLPSLSKTTTTTKTESSSDGNSTEKGQQTENKTANSTEEKETQTVAADSPELQYRKLAVTEVDVLYYTKAKSLFQVALTGYMAALDFIDKNSEKIAQPKGSGGSGSAYSSMY